MCLIYFLIEMFMEKIMRALCIEFLLKGEGGRLILRVDLSPL